MSRPIVLTPMPVVLSVTTAAEAETAFGAGSQFALAARRHIEGPRVYPPPTPEQLAADQRARVADALETAFLTVGQCVELVEAHARALFTSDGSNAFTLSEWRTIAFGSLACIYDLTPELLPIGPAVHADCHGGFSSRWCSSRCPSLRRRPSPRAPNASPGGARDDHPCSLLPDLRAALRRRRGPQPHVLEAVPHRAPASAL